ncbi:hypothetical protein ACOMHN_044211 [Nucella lapillus]
MGTNVTVSCSPPGSAAGKRLFVLKIKKKTINSPESTTPTVLVAALSVSRAYDKAKLKLSMSGATATGSVSDRIIRLVMSKASCSDEAMYICEVTYYNSRAVIAKSEAELKAEVSPGQLHMTATPPSVFSWTVDDHLELTCRGPVGTPSADNVIVWQYRHKSKEGWRPYDGNSTTDISLESVSKPCYEEYISTLRREITLGDNKRQYRCLLRRGNRSYDQFDAIRSVGKVTKENPPAQGAVNTFGNQWRPDEDRQSTTFATDTSTYPEGSEFESESAVNSTFGNQQGSDEDRQSTTFAPDTSTYPEEQPTDSSSESFGTGATVGVTLAVVVVIVLVVIIVLWRRHCVLPCADDGGHGQRTQGSRPPNRDSREEPQAVRPVSDIYEMAEDVSPRHHTENQPPSVYISLETSDIGVPSVYSHVTPGENQPPSVYTSLETSDIGVPSVYSHVTHYGNVGAAVDPRQTMGYQEVEENTNLTFTSDEYSGTASWMLKAATGSDTNIGSCSSTCTVNIPVFTLTANSATSSSLTTSCTAMNSSQSGAECQCNAKSVTKKFELHVIDHKIPRPSANRRQPPNAHTRHTPEALAAELGSSSQPGTLDLSPTANDTSNTADMSGRCDVTMSMPVTSGTYSCSVTVNPGNTQTSCGSFAITRPSPPTIRCPSDFIPENTPLTCTCNANNIGQPGGRLRWYTGTGSNFSTEVVSANYDVTTLEMTRTVTRGDHGRKFRCVNNWMVKVNATSNYTASVACLAQDPPQSILTLNPTLINLTPNTMSMGTNVTVSCSPPGSAAGKRLFVLNIKKKPINSPESTTPTVLVAALSVSGADDKAKLNLSMSGATATGSVSDRIIRLVMSKASCSDEAMYICEATYYNSRTVIAKSEAELKAEVSPGQLHMTATPPSVLSWTVDDHLELTCRGPVGTPSADNVIVWQYRHKSKEGWRPYDGNSTTDISLETVSKPCYEEYISTLCREITLGDNKRQYRCLLRRGNRSYDQFDAIRSVGKVTEGGCFMMASVFV